MHTNFDIREILTVFRGLIFTVWKHLNIHWPALGSIIAIDKDMWCSIFGDIRLVQWLEKGEGRREGAGCGFESPQLTFLTKTNKLTFADKKNVLFSWLLINFLMLTVHFLEIPHNISLHYKLKLFYWYVFVVCWY